ncbi:MAG: pyridoxamine 5'-phosphate oxidase family protein [Janthinobacterium lividum]
MNAIVSADNPPPPASERVRIRRGAELGHYDRERLNAIVDAAYLCHLAFSDARGTHCIPMASWRIDDHLYLHGSNGSQLLKAAAAGVQVCATVTHLDGLVLARSAFHHSMNYRSAVMVGVCEPVSGDAKALALDALTERMGAGRAAQARRANEKELNATTVLRLPLSEFACKTRSGGPNDAPEDKDLPVWAGELPLVLAAGVPVADKGNQAPAPTYVAAWADSLPDAPI